MGNGREKEDGKIFGGQDGAHGLFAPARTNW